MKTAEGHHVVTVRCCYCRHEAQISDASRGWVCEDGSLKFGLTPDRGEFLPAGWFCTADCRKRQRKP